MSNFFGTAIAGQETPAVYDGPVFEGYNVTHGAEFAIAMESASDQLEIVAALAELDVQTTQFVAESSKEGADLDYVAENLSPVLEATGAGVFGKIKNAIQTLWGKVKAFFASVIRMLDGVTKSAQDFVKKYKKQIENLKLSGMKYEMHNYSVEDLALEYKGDAIKTAEGVVNTILANVNAKAEDQGALDAVQKQVDEYREKTEDRLDVFRSTVLGGSGKLEAADFRTEVRKKLRSGKEDNDKAEVSVNIQQIISEIEGTNKLNTKISKIQKDSDKAFSESIKLVDKLEKAINKGSDTTVNSKVAPKAAFVASTISRELSAKQAIVNTAISEWSGAVKERDGVYKRVIMKAFSYKQAE